jgi:hypothetical protein
MMSNFTRLISSGDLPVALSNSVIGILITELCRQQAEVIPKHKNEHGLNNEQGGARQKLLAT